MSWNVSLALNAITHIANQPDQHDQRWYRRELPGLSPTMCYMGHVVVLGLGIPFSWVQGPMASPSVYSYIQIGQKRFHVPYMGEQLLQLPYMDARGLIYAPDKVKLCERLVTILQFSPASRDLKHDEIEAAIRRIEALAEG